MNDKERRGQRAREIVEDEIFSSAWAEVERSAIEAMLAVPFDRPQDLAAMQARVWAVRAMQAELRSVITAGDEASRRTTRPQPV